MGWPARSRPGGFLSDGLACGPPGQRTARGHLAGGPPAWEIVPRDYFAGLVPSVSEAVCLPPLVET